MGPAVCLFKGPKTIEKIHTTSGGTKLYLSAALVKYLHMSGEPEEMQMSKSRFYQDLRERKALETVRRKKKNLHARRKTAAIKQRKRKKDIRKA